MGAGRPSKIDIEVLERILSDEGKSQKEAAKFFNCSPAAISKALKKLDYAVKRCVAQSIVMYEFERGLRQRGWL